MKHIRWTYIKKALADKLIFLSVFCLAAVFRLINPNWDQGFHLHPDERFLTMVGNSMQLPHSLAQYLNPTISLFNPANTGFKFYVYGIFPVVLNKILAMASLSDTYNGFTLQGRLLSGIADLFTLVFVYKMLLLIRKHTHIPNAIVIMGTFLYTVAVLPIQLSHFFAVDLFLSLFLFASVYFLLKLYYEHQWYNLPLSAALFALAAASKISAIYMLPLHMTLLLLVSLQKNYHLFPFLKNKLPKGHVLKTGVLFVSLLAVFFAILYFVLRFTDPYYFADGNLLHPAPNPSFVDSLKTLETFNNAGFPPSVQWVHKTPVFFSLYNLVFYGIGIPFSLFLVLGIYQAVMRHRSKELLVILVWSMLFFLYQSTQFVKTMRYFIFLYPFFAIFAGFGWYYFVKNIASQKNERIDGKKALSKVLQTVIIILLLLWPLSYISVYLHTTTRIAASEWINQNISENNFLLNEHWDDPLPLPITPKHYAGELLPVFDPDTPEKWTKMDTLLAKGDYYILSSNRAWGSIPTVPERYPQMIHFYGELFAGRLQYKKVAEFTSYPSLSYLGIPITFQDDWAEESFTVYDHPKVMIFKKY